MNDPNAVYAQWKAFRDMKAADFVNPEFPYLKRGLRAWSRNAEAGLLVDRLCSDWMIPKVSVTEMRCVDCASPARYDGCANCGNRAKFEEVHLADVKPYSTEGTASLELFKAFPECGIVAVLSPWGEDWSIDFDEWIGEEFCNRVIAPDPELAIARACLVMETYGITLESV